MSVFELGSKNNQSCGNSKVSKPLYSVDSIKRTVLLKVQLQKYFLVSIKCTVYRTGIYWKISRQINFAY